MENFTLTFPITSHLVLRISVVGKPYCIMSPEATAPATGQVLKKEAMF